VVYWPLSDHLGLHLCMAATLKNSRSKVIPSSSCNIEICFKMTRFASQLLLNLPKTMTNADTTTQTLLDRLPCLCLPRARGNHSDMQSEHIQLHWEVLLVQYQVHQKLAITTNGYASRNHGKVHCPQPQRSPLPDLRCDISPNPCYLQPLISARGAFRCRHLSAFSPRHAGCANTASVTFTLFSFYYLHTKLVLLQCLEREARL
jgi:hypothetical protein